MNRSRVFLSLTLLLAWLPAVQGYARTGEAGQAPVQEIELQRAAPEAGAPQVASWQGHVKVNGEPYTGTGYFKLAVVSLGGATTYWTNDGTASGEPAQAVTLQVSSGLFDVLLGETSLAHMTALPASVFAGTERYLRVWLSTDGSTFTLLSPDRHIGAAPYALQAQEASNSDRLDGQHASAFASSTHTHWGQSWTGSGTGLTLSGGTDGISGNGSSRGVSGTSSASGGHGVEGVASATSGHGAGVYGTGASPTGYAGRFQNSAATGWAIGVYGSSTSTSGVGGYFLADTETAGANSAGVFGRADSNDGYGLAGHAYHGGVGVGAWSYSGRLIEAYDGDFPGGTLRFWVGQDGSVHADGTFGTYGASTQDGAIHGTTALQSTAAWIEDFGRARLVDGATVVTIAPDFAGMADLGAAYHVFLTAEGDSQGLYVSHLTPMTFEVHEQGGGRSSIVFSYRIVARPAGADGARLPRVDIAPAGQAPARPAEGEPGRTGTVVTPPGSD